MKKEPLRGTYIEYALSRAAMRKISAGDGEFSRIPSPDGNSWNENEWDRVHAPHRASQRMTLLEAYRKLSRRECEVLDKIAEGKTNAKIAKELYIAKSTLETHIANIDKALNLKWKGRLREWINLQFKKK